MKKTWMTACLAALLVLPLAGCGGDRTGSGVTTPSPSPSANAGAGQTAPSSHLPDPDNGSDDLAGADGVVGGQEHSGTGNTGDDRAPGQAEDNPLEDLGEGVRDTLDDMGDAARDMGRSARNAIEGR